MVILEKVYKGIDTLNTFSRITNNHRNPER